MMVPVVGVTLTVAAAAGVTVRARVPVRPSGVAEMFAPPGAAAMISPVGATVATGAVIPLHGLVVR